MHSSHGSSIYLVFPLSVVFVGWLVLLLFFLNCFIAGLRYPCDYLVLNFLFTKDRDNV